MDVDDVQNNKYSGTVTAKTVFKSYTPTEEE